MFFRPNYLFIFILGFVVLDAKYTAKHQSIECKSNPKYVPKEVCTVKDSGDGDTLLDMYFDYVPGKLTNVWSQIKLFRKHNDKWEPFFLNIRLNLCTAMEILKSNELLATFASLMDMVNPKLKNGCPLEGPVDLKGKRASEMIPENMPPIFPSGEYHLLSRVWKEPGNVTIHEMSNYFTLTLEIPELLRAPKQ